MCRPQTWIAWSEGALKGCRKIGDRQNEGAMLSNLGTAYLDLGEIRRAIGYFEQHRAIARKIGDRWMAVSREFAPADRSQDAANSLSSR